MMEKKGEYIQIGNVAKSLGITTRTIHYYEEVGLIEAPVRVSGPRKYSKQDVLRLKFILKLKELNLTLQDMQELVTLYDGKNKNNDWIVPQILNNLNAHLYNLDMKILKLSSFRKDLTHYRARVQEMLVCQVKNDNSFI